MDEKKEPLKMKQSSSSSAKLPSFRITEAMIGVMKMMGDKPSFITISYVQPDGTVERWWQTDRFPNNEFVPTLEGLRESVVEYHAQFFKGEEGMGKVLELPKKGDGDD